MAAPQTQATAPASTSVPAPVPAPAPVTAPAPAAVEPAAAAPAPIEIASAIRKTSGTVKEVASNDFILAYAKHLKRTGKMELPKWADLAKTGAYKELAPYDPDWYYVRAASIARRVYIKGGMGVGEFRRVYGGKDRRGSRPGHFALASGNIIRTILKQLETMKVLEKDPHGGRRISSTGRRDLDRIASQLVGAMSHTLTVPAPVSAPAPAPAVTAQ